MFSSFSCSLPVLVIYCYMTDYPKTQRLKTGKKKKKLHQNNRYKLGPPQAMESVPLPPPPTHNFYSSCIPLGAGRELCI